MPYENWVGPHASHYTEAVFQAFVQQAEDTGSPDLVPGRVTDVYPGLEVAWDECCDGMLWTRVVQIAPAAANAAPTLAKGHPCAVPWWEITFGTGLLRCAPSPKNKRPPSADELNTTGWQTSFDTSLMGDVILCDPRTYRMVGWSPLGSQGGCVGGEWQYIVRVDICRCPPPVPPEESP